MTKLIYPDLSYKVVGILFGVFKELGSGLHENLYQRAVKMALEKEKIHFLEQVRFDIEFCGKFVGRYYIDFVVENKLVLELKSKKSLNRNDIRQVYAYLKKSDLELGLLARFGTSGVEVKRILKGFK